MMKDLMKRWWADVVVVAAFAAIAFAYFMPADLDGRILNQHDASAGRGAGQEQLEYRARTGERTRWSNATFSGMPTYQTAPSYDSSDTLQTAVKAYHLWLPENVWFVFVYLLGFYILLRAFDFRQWMAALGAIVWAFSSYFFIIIAAGHIWKVWALAYLPPMIAGLVMAYRGRYLWGFAVTAVFTAFEINANHVQMTYYYLMVILAMVVAFFVEALKTKQLQRFWKASAVALAAAIVGIGINASNLYHTWQYGQESMRGKSELTKAGEAQAATSGLDRDYITQWSYGIGETWTLLIPNAKGGAHNIQLAENERAMEQCDPELRSIVGQWYQYWGDQPFTAGPVYVGAFVLMLFFLGLIVVRGPMKWALLAATLLSIALSWGKNMMWLTDLFIDYVPMYAKFRTVSSILVVAEFTIPLLAMLGLREWMVRVDGGLKSGSAAKDLLVAFGLTGGFCLLFAIAPGLYEQSFVSEADKMQLAQYIPSEYMAVVLANIGKVREAVFVQDCWRSLAVIAIGTVLLLLFLYKKLTAKVAVGSILVLCLVEMWMVNKRYLNDGMFVEKIEREAPQQMTQTDRIILQDTSLDYRVMNLSPNAFNENETSYYHKSIGGYHAAKLRRYQELIDAYLAPEIPQAINAIASANGNMETVNGDSIFPVINMLNAKYLVMPLQGGGTMPLLNPYAMGHAWAVGKVRYVDTANDELESLGAMDLHREAVADRRFESILGQAAEAQVTCTLTAYEPNELTYSVETDRETVVVFSEIYYPGWKATIDGAPAEVGRVNYVLRALRMPQGKHEVVLTFKPASVRTTETIAYISYAFLLLAIAGGVVCQRRKK